MYFQMKVNKLKMCHDLRNFVEAHEQGKSSKWLIDSKDIFEDSWKIFVYFYDALSKRKMYIVTCSFNYFVQYVYRFSLLL